MTATRTTEPTNLASALIAFQAEMPTVGKTKTAKIRSDKGNYEYSYADLAVITEKAMPLLTKHGLSFSCRPRRVEPGGNYELAGMLRHVSGEFDEGALPIMGRTSQEIGSSITYMRRYLLGTMTGVITDDDDDGHAGNTAQRTSQPSPLEQAQERVKQAWTLLTRKPFVFEEMRDGYEQRTGQPLIQAGPEDLNRFADGLDQERTSAGQQQAAQGAERALGARPAPDNAAGPTDPGGSNNVPATQGAK